MSQRTLLSDSSPAILQTLSVNRIEGYLEKRGEGITGRNWKRRWFVLNEDGLYYYEISVGGIKHLKGKIGLREITFLGTLKEVEMQEKVLLDDSPNFSTNHKTPHPDKETGGAIQSLSSSAEVSVVPSKKNGVISHSQRATLTTSLSGSESHREPATYGKLSLSMNNANDQSRSSKVVWKWIDERGYWHRYDEETEKLLENTWSHRSVHPVVPLDHNQWLRDHGPWEVDFRKMVQRNSKTGFRRRIERTIQNASEPSKNGQGSDKRMSFIGANPYLMLSFSLSDSEETGWRFVVDVPNRRYHLRTLEGEYKMWFWLEGIRSAIAKISTKQICEESFLRRNQKQVEENNYIVGELQSRLEFEKEQHKQALEEVKSTMLLLRRELWNARERLKKYEERAQREQPESSVTSSTAASDPNSPLGVNTKALEGKSLSEASAPSSQLLNGFSALQGKPLEQRRATEEQASEKNSPTQSESEKEREMRQLISEAQEEISLLRKQLQNKDGRIKQLTLQTKELDQTAKVKHTQLENEIERLSLQIQSLTLSKDILKENNDQLQLELESLKAQESPLALQRTVDALPSPNLLTHNNNNNNSTSRSMKFSPQFSPAASRWRPDEAVTHCTACKTQFTFLNRKHHCRNCGGIFCYECCPLTRLCITRCYPAPPLPLSQQSKE